MTPATLERPLSRPASAGPPHACALERALGRHSACPGRRCAFWEEGGAVLRPGCALARTPIDLERAEVAERLLALRRRIELAASEEDARAARAAFRGLLAAAFEDDE